MRMVEKVARRLCEAADDDWDWSVFYIVDANDTAETGRDVYRNMARAAIEAMREPTDGMVDAPYDADIDFGPGGTGDVQANPRNVWRAMIDKAIQESEE